MPRCQRTWRRTSAASSGESARLPTWSSSTYLEPRWHSFEAAFAGWCRGAQASGIGQFRHFRAQVGVHAIRLAQEVAEGGRDRGLVGHEPPHRGGVHRFGMRALTDLRELLRVAEQQQSLGRHRGAEHRSQGELAGLIDDQQVERTPRHGRCGGESPGGAAEHTQPVSAWSCRKAARHLPTSAKTVHFGADGSLGLLLPTSAGSRPASMMASSMFSTTACDCATTPMRQW